MGLFLVVQVFVLVSQNSLFDLLFLYKQRSPSVSHMFFCKDRQYGKEEMSGGWDMAPTIQCIQWRAMRPCEICHFRFDWLSRLYCGCLEA